MSRMTIMHLYSLKYERGIREFQMWQNSYRRTALEVAISSWTDLEVDNNNDANLASLVSPWHMHSSPQHAFSCKWMELRRTDQVGVDCLSWSPQVLCEYSKKRERRRTLM